MTNSESTSEGRYQVKAINDQSVCAVVDTTDDSTVSRPMMKEFASRYARKLNELQETDPERFAHILTAIGNPNPLA